VGLDRELQGPLAVSGPIRKEITMKWYQGTWPLLAAGLLVAGAAQAAPSSPDEPTPVATSSAAPTSSSTRLQKQVRRELASLPYYGVFDLLTYQVKDDGTVVLGGEVYHGPLKSSAEKVVEKIPGVKKVENKIELLPVSMSDDDVRWQEYRAIYFDPALQRYGTAESQAAALRPRFYAWGWNYSDWPFFNGAYWSGSPFYGMEPIGEYAIHIIVKNGHVTLVGMVDNKADRNIAGLQAKGVFGAFSVANDLQVLPQKNAAAAPAPTAP